MANDQLLGFQKKTRAETRRLQLIMNHIEKLSPEGRAWLRVRLVMDRLEELKQVK